MNAVTLTLQLSSLDGDALDREMIQSLQGRGYSVLKVSAADPARLETPGEYCRRIGIHPNHFSRRWRRSGCPQVECERSPTGRVLRLAATPSLDVFMLGNKARDMGAASLDRLLKAARGYARAYATPEASGAGLRLLDCAVGYFGKRGQV